MSAALLVAALLQEELTLEYKFAKTKGRPMNVDTTLELAVEGDDTAVQLIKSAAEFFSFQKIRVTGTEDLAISKTESKGGARVKLKPKSVKVDGLYDDTPFSYEFSFPGLPPPTEDKLGQAIYAMSAEEDDLKFDRRGAYESQKLLEDAAGESLRYVSWPLPRFPEDGKVTVGKEWEVRWAGKREDDQKRGTIDYGQTCKVERVENDVAVISVLLTGALKLKPEIAKKYEETKTEAGIEVESKATARFDIKAGRVTKIEFDGKVKNSFDGPDEENAKRYTLDVIFTVKGAVESR